VNKDLYNNLYSRSTQIKASKHRIIESYNQLTCKKQLT